MEKQKVSPSDFALYQQIGWGWLLTVICGVGLIPFAVLSMSGLLSNSYRDNPVLAVISSIILLFIFFFFPGMLMGYIQSKWWTRTLVPGQKWVNATVFVVFTLSIVLVIDLLVPLSALYKCQDMGYGVALCTRNHDWILRCIFKAFWYGLAMSLPQWWILRQYARRANWWIIANIAVILALCSMSTTTDEGFVDSLADSLIIFVVEMFFVVLLYATIAGLTMYYIARGEKQKRKITPTQ